MDYETLKGYSPREIDLIIESLTEIRKEQDRAMRNPVASRGGETLQIGSGLG